MNASINKTRRPELSSTVSSPRRNEERQIDNDDDEQVPKK